MNEIDQVDWHRITDAHGSEVGFLPKYLKEVTADDSKTWVPALEVLGDTLEYSGISEATVTALPFLISMCEDQTLAALPRVIDLLGRIALRCKTFQFAKPCPENSISESEYEAICQVIQRARALLFEPWRNFRDLLSSDNMAIRCSVPYVLGMLLADADDGSFAEALWREAVSNVCNSLEHVATTDPIALVRASALQALGQLGRVYPTNVSVLVKYAVSESPPAIKGAAAIGVVRAGVTLPPDPVVTVLSEIVTNPEVFKKALSSTSYAAEWRDSSLGATYRALANQSMPEDVEGSAGGIRFVWFQSPLFQAVWAICRLAGEMVKPLLPALIATVENDTGDDYQFAHVTGPILLYVFAGVKAKDATKLTDSQRSILLAFYNNPALWNTRGPNQSSILYEVGLPKAQDRFRPAWRELIGGPTG